MEFYLNFEKLRGLLPRLNEPNFAFTENKYINQVLLPMLMKMEDNLYVDKLDFDRFDIDELSELKDTLNEQANNGNNIRNLACALDRLRPKAKLHRQFF
jgi:hypothetical protein